MVVCEIHNSDSFLSRDVELQIRAGFKDNDARRDRKILIEDLLSESRCHRSLFSSSEGRAVALHLGPNRLESCNRCIPRRQYLGSNETGARKPTERSGKGGLRFERRGSVHCIPEEHERFSTNEPFLRRLFCRGQVPHANQRGGRESSAKCKNRNRRHRNQIKIDVLVNVFLPERLVICPTVD